MTSKTKLLKKGKYIPGTTIPAPVKKTENKSSNNTITKRNLRKEAEARTRARSIRNAIKHGMKKEQIEEMFADMDNRMILVLINGAFSIEDGTRKKRIVKRNKQGLKISEEFIDVPNILHGLNAVKKFVEKENMVFMNGTPSGIWILSHKNTVEEDVKKLNVIGRCLVTKPEQKQKTEKKIKTSTQNTTEKKVTAKLNRKTANVEKAKMRPFYAALRKGGIKERIKKYNPKLAEKIEAWIKETKASKKIEASRKEADKEHRAKHNQLTSTERKANKRARKTIKHLAMVERRKNAENAAMKRNIEAHKTRKKKPVQTEIKPTA